ncbi:TIGR03086 family metal-binding protein [Streptomyces sp. NPDC051644]|uniref:TIGR03086 family metal-binding protein n=1 Tax=Streptomyces sp. NPDC051644 TaxID=3365666 RepID=UPI00378FE214
MNIVELDRAAVLESVRIVEQARPEDWERPTPCSRWTLRLLVEHMSVQHHGFAAAARGEGGDPSLWEPRPLGADPVGSYRTAACDVLDTFAQPSVLTQEFSLPEINPEGTFPGSVAVGFHFIDYVVHSWDVAAALGMRPEFSAEIIEAALPVALRVPGGERRERPGAAFRPALAPADRAAADGTATTFDLVLTTLGRSPDWTAPNGR